MFHVSNEWGLNECGEARGLGSQLSFGEEQLSATSQHILRGLRGASIHLVEIKRREQNERRAAGLGRLDNNADRRMRRLCMNGQNSECAKLLGKGLQK